MGDLQNIKYTSILPDGRNGNYTGGQRLIFTIPDRYGFIDMKQSYLKVKVDNTSTQTGSVAGFVPPVVFPRNLGGNVLFERCQLKEMTGNTVIEDIDGYNSYVSIQKSHCFETDQYPPQDLVERVGAHLNDPRDRRSQDAGVNYFQPLPKIDTAVAPNALVGGADTQTAECCLPIYMGAFSNLDESHEVFPNMPLGGSQIEFHLEKPAVCLSELAHGFAVIDGGILVDNSKNVESTLVLHAAPAAAQAVCEIALAECNLTEANMSLDACAYRVGMAVETSDADGGNAQNNTIASIQVSDGTAGTIKLTLADNFAVASTSRIKARPITFNYNISSVELRIMEVQPSNPAAIRQALQKGINFKTTTLTKLSQPAGILNQVLDIPAVNERAMSIYALPCEQANLNSSNSANSRLYPKIQNANDVDYIWAIKNFLIPNRAVNVNPSANATSDNTIYYKQKELAMRHLRELRSFIDGRDPVAAPLSLPFFYPISLCPVGNSYRLIDSEPQLRLTNSNAGVDQNPSTLFYVFVNHTRTLMATDDAIEVML